MSNYDSTQDTLKHIQQVQGLLSFIQAEIEQRALVHDVSKLNSPEKELFDEFTPKLAALTYGSDEYKECLKQMGPALQHHYQHNSHHPEYYEMWKCPVCEIAFKEKDVPLSGVYENIRLCPLCCKNGSIMECALVKTSGINGMTLLDVIEMLADWKAASLRHADGDFHKSLYINKERFGISDQLFQIILHTVGELGW